MSGEVVGVVLAAGSGTRLRPISRWRPKALCPVGGVALVDHALARLRPQVAASAVNLCHGAEQLDAHLAPDVHRSFERPEALGTAGALGGLRGWIEGRDVLVTNADAWLGAGIEVAVAKLVEGWDRQRHRLLCVRDARRGDFGELRYCGVALVPARDAAGFEATPSGLYEVAWRSAFERGELDLVATDSLGLGTAVPFIDCGTPSDYLLANLAASGGRSVVDRAAAVGEGAVVERCVLWDGAAVAPGEVLRDAVRSARGTVLVR